MRTFLCLTALLLVGCGPTNSDILKEMIDSCKGRVEMGYRHSMFNREVTFRCTDMKGVKHE